MIWTRIFEPNDYDRFSPGERLCRFISDKRHLIGDYKIIEEPCQYWDAKSQSYKDGKRLIFIYKEEYQKN